MTLIVRWHKEIDELLEPKLYPGQGLNLNLPNSYSYIQAITLLVFVTLGKLSVAQLVIEPH